MWHLRYNLQVVHRIKQSGNGRTLTGRRENADDQNQKGTEPWSKVMNIAVWCFIVRLAEGPWA